MLITVLAVCLLSDPQCHDDPNWYRDGVPLQNCVFFGSPGGAGSCTEPWAVNAHGIAASEACPISCGTGCSVAGSAGSAGKQARDLPTSCATFPEFMTFSNIVTEVCCSAGVACPQGGLPAACTADCADVLLPMQRACAEFLVSVSMSETVDAVAATCPAIQTQCPVDTRPAGCIEADDAAKCRGWGLHWDEVQKACTPGGH
jgi:hypothetical protein